MRRKIATFIRYRDIVWYRTLAGLKSEARQNFLGYIWFLLEPMLTTAIVYVVSVLILRSGGPDRVVMLLLGSLTWTWFEGSVMTGMNGIKSKMHIMMHFTLPKYIFPLVNIFINTWKFLCVFAVVLVLCALSGYPPNINFLFLPLVLGAQLILIIGLALPLAIMVTYSNDLTTVTSSIFRLMMFLSGVFFSPSIIPLAAVDYFYSNPMAGLIDSYRAIVMRHHPPDFYSLMYATIFGLYFGLIGIIWSNYVDGKILKRVSN